MEELIKTKEWILDHLKIKELWDSSKTNEGTYIVLECSNKEFAEFYWYIKEKNKGENK